jgi:hypothetical protein
MPRKPLTAEEKKAFAEKMKAAREAKNAPAAPKTPDTPEAPAAPDLSNCATGKPSVNLNDCKTN